MNQRNTDEATQHLRIDEILGYVTLTKPDGESVALCAAVNRHIRGCSTCLRRVRAFLQVQDGFQGQAADGDFRLSSEDLLVEESLG